MLADTRTRAAPLAINSTSRTHAGARRAVNEDRVLDARANGIWAIADGMGGHKGGAAAAERLIDALSRVDHGASGYVYLSDVAREVEAINSALFEQGRLHGAGSSGSTLSALIIHDHHYACLWAGDSRAYLLRDGRLALITHDHSLVQQLIDAGGLAEAARAAHPERHVITRAVGAAARIELEQRFGALAPGDRFLVCSDGLTACLADEDIAVLIAGEDLAAAADGLFAAALSHEPADNVSFVLVSVAAH